MTLDQYLTSRAISTVEAAAQLGRDRTIVSRYRRREVTPSADIMAAIWEWTGGLVTPPEMLAKPRTEE